MFKKQELSYLFEALEDITRKTGILRIIEHVLSVNLACAIVRQ